MVLLSRDGPRGTQLNFSLSRLHSAKTSVQHNSSVRVKKDLREAAMSVCHVESKFSSYIAPATALFSEIDLAGRMAFKAN